MKANFEIIAGSKKMSDIMHSVDMFEKGRVIGEISNFSITYDKAVLLKDVEKIIPVIVEAYEKQGQIVSLLHLQNISDENTILKNNKIKPYIDKWVKVISNGETWFLLSDYIKQRGIVL